MLAQHRNLDLLGQVNLLNSADWHNQFRHDVIWHFYNADAPELAGDYFGHEGIEDFLRKLAGLSSGSFSIEPIDARAIGDELVVAQTRNRFASGETMVEFDVVTVWRIIENKIAEVWDIPATNTLRTLAH